MGGGRGAFCPLFKISLGNPYLKILDLAKLFVADAPMKKKNQKMVSPPPQSTLKYFSEIKTMDEGIKIENCPD